VTRRRALPGTLRATIAGNIRAIRQARNLSQVELAHMADLHRTYAGAIERGERNMSIDKLEQIADALGVTAADLVRTDGASAGA